MSDIILIHPRYTPWDTTYNHFPLGLLQISSRLDSEAYKIKILDQRVDPNWKQALLNGLKSNPICIGITTMIGTQILGGLSISKLVKENSDSPVVWGGPFPRMLPHVTIQNKYIDIICEGEGENTFYELVKTLEKNKPLEKVKGIWFKNNGNIKRNKPRKRVDLNKIPDPPYHLINNPGKYKYTTWFHSPDIPERTANINTSVGCPYQCTYCYNPTLYPKWKALSAERVVSLIKNLHYKHKFKGFLFMDDNFFIDQKRVNDIMKGIIKEGLDIEMGFQGSRADIICRMSDEEFELLHKAGAKWHTVGAESGSPRILKLLKKGVTVNEVYTMNRRVAEYDDMHVLYNFMTGIPTETTKEMLMTVKMMTKLRKENPNARIPYIFIFTPWPKTEIFDLAVKHGYVPPKTLEEWGNVEWNIVGSRRSQFNPRPWISEEHKRLYKKILLLQEFIGYNYKYLKISFLKLLASLYRPIAEKRLEKNFYDFMPEVDVVQFVIDYLSNRKRKEGDIIFAGLEEDKSE